MKPSLSVLIITPLLLAGCATVATGPLTLPLQERLRNPLVAERYWAEMVDHMANFTQAKNPIMKDPVKAAVIESERVRGLERVSQARKQKKEGTNGAFQSVSILEDTEGEVLLRNAVLYFGTTFLTYPNPSINVYLTGSIDPRNAAFPDKTSVNLGPLQTAYGAQEYPVPATTSGAVLRTAVLYDTQLQRILGFAQLSK